LEIIHSNVYLQFAQYTPVPSKLPKNQSYDGHNQMTDDTVICHMTVYHLHGPAWVRMCAYIYVRLQAGCQCKAGHAIRPCLLFSLCLCLNQSKVVALRFTCTQMMGEQPRIVLQSAET